MYKYVCIGAQCMHYDRYIVLLSELQRYLLMLDQAKRVILTYL